MVAIDTSLSKEVQDQCFALFFKYTIYLFLVVLGLHCYMSFSLFAVNGAYALVAVHRFLILVASPAAEHRL